MSTTDRPICILVCALGGEGGGVLAEWLVEVAWQSGHSAQGTSVPGVAQRTGATTYYLEIFPRPDTELAGKRPVFGTNPVPGALDLLVSSELLETVRQIGHGMSDAARTQVISSLHRTLTTAEKMVPGDGRRSADELQQVVRTHAREARLFDMAALAQANGTAISAVLLGAIAASGALPFARAAYEDVIRRAGIGVDASLRGFAAAFDAIAGSAPPREPFDSSGRTGLAVATGDAPHVLADLPRPLPDWLQPFPPALHETITLGHERLVDYQDETYAELYIDRLHRMLDAERAGVPADGEVMLPATNETARWLALWMAYDDVVRVADLKSRAERHARVRREVRADDGDIVKVYDHFKPGVAELAGLLPARWADAVKRWEQRRVAAGRAPLAWPIKLASHGVLGMAMLRLLASARHLRRHGSRDAAEQALIERWLAAVMAGARVDALLGRELAACGRLIKGYGTTNERGKANLLHIVDHLASAAAFDTPAARAAAIGAARAAALADDAGKALDQALVAHGAPKRPLREQPIRWVRHRPAGRAGAASSRDAA